MKIVYIDGDGIGPEVMTATRRVMDRVTGGRIEWIEAYAGEACFEHKGEPLPVGTVALLREHKLGIKGPTTTPGGHGFSSVNVALRQRLDLYQGLRPAFSLGIPGTCDGVNIALFRENTEGLYDSDEALSDDGGSSILTARFTRRAMLRLARAAFLYAKKHGFSRVTNVDKQNIHKVWGQLYHRALMDVAHDFPSIQANHRLVDATNMFLTLAPQSWEVIATENMFGDILADHCAALMGGLGVAPGANIGDHIFLAEAVHGSWPERAGEGIANPTALMLSGAMLLEHIGQTDQALSLREVIKKTIRAGNCTDDLKGTLTTEQFTEAILHWM